MTTADDLAGIDTISRAQERLALFVDPLGSVPNLSGDTMVRFRLHGITGEGSVGIRSPLETQPPRGHGFVPGGRTGGDAREFIINNGTASDLGAYDIELIPLQ